MPFRSMSMLLHSKVTDFQKKTYRTEKKILRLAKVKNLLYCIKRMNFWIINLSYLQEKMHKYVFKT